MSNIKHKTCLTYSLETQVHFMYRADSEPARASRTVHTTHTDNIRQNVTVQQI